jgi:hypothetical protein
MKDEDRKKQAEEMFKILPHLGEFLEKKAKEIYKYKPEQKDFILSMALNLLGNLTMQWSDDSVEAKAHLSSVVVNNLIEWFGVSIKDYRVKKEAH